MPELKDIQIRNAYSQGQDIVLTYREGGRKKRFVIEDFQWYFAVKKSDYEKKKHVFDNMMSQNVITQVDFDSKFPYFVKIYCIKKEGKSSPHRLALIECKDQGIKTYEADLNSVRRFLLDNNITISSEYDVLYFDIETDDTDRKIEIGAKRILSCAAVDREGNVYYYDDDDEKTLLEKMWRLFTRYDVICGWNSDGFDLPYIRGYSEFFVDETGMEKRKWVPGREEFHGIKHDWYKMPTVDMLVRARKIFKEGASLKSFSLNNVANYFLGKGKVKVEGKLIDLYHKDRETFKKYNIQDATLLKELDEKVGMLDMIGMECNLGKALLLNFRGASVGEILDMMIMREAHKQGLFTPSRMARETTAYVGGLVFEPKPGHYKNVYVFDYSSLYPSIIISSNIGFDSVLPYDSKDGIENPGTGVKFRKDKQSVVASVVDSLVQARQQYKKKRLKLIEEHKTEGTEYKTARSNEVIVKELSNSMYGIMGDQHQRYYSTSTAESITKTGHWLLEYARDFFNKLEGCNVIYGDTDSIFVESKNELDVNKALAEYHKNLKLDLVKKYNFDPDEITINLKYEKKYQHLIMLEKKYYVGKVSEIEGKQIDKLDAKGLDLVKKATIPMALESQDHVIKMIFEGKTLSDILKYVDVQKKRILTETFTFDEIKIVFNSSKPLSAYKGHSIRMPFVRVAQYLTDKNGFLTDKEIEYVVVNNDLPKDGMNGLAIRSDELYQYDGTFDRNFYWESKIYEPMKRILRAVFPEIVWDHTKKVAEGQQKLW